MSSGTATPRVRLVRCPKCRMVLPEVEDVPLYKCGGCDVILVVKNRKSAVESTLPLQEIGDADSDKLVHVSENGESTSSTPQEVHSSPAAGEVLSSDTLFASPNEHMEQPRRSEHQGFNHVRSTDSFGTADFVSPSSEFSDPDIEHFSKSAASGISHAYDGGIPSDDGMDDQFLGQKVYSFENNYRDANYLVPEERRRREKSPAESLMNCNARNNSSNLSNKKPYGTAKYRKWHPDEALEPVMQRCLRDEYPSSIPFSQRTSLPGYKNAGPSCELHNEFTDYNEQESMKLGGKSIFLHITIPRKKLFIQGMTLAIPVYAAMLECGHVRNSCLIQCFVDSILAIVVMIATDIAPLVPKDTWSLVFLPYEQVSYVTILNQSVSDPESNASSFSSCLDWKEACLCKPKSQRKLNMRSQRAPLLSSC